MKKLFVCSIAAIVIGAACVQPASAWINSQFGAGLNWDVSCGGNSLFWGLCNCGQPGAPDFYRGNFAPAYPAPQAAPCPCQNRPAVAPTAAAAVPANANAATQTLRYPNYPVVPPYRYPTNYYRGY